MRCGSPARIGLPDAVRDPSSAHAFEPDDAVSAESNRPTASAPSVSRTCSFHSSRGNIENSAWWTSMIPSGVQAGHGSCSAAYPSRSSRASASRPSFTPATYASTNARSSSASAAYAF